MNPTPSQHQALAIKLFQEWEKGTLDADKILELFSADAKFFMQGPNHPPNTGHKQIKEGFENIFKLLKDFSYRIVNVAENGNLMFTERVEKFVWVGKHNVEMGVVSVSEVGPDGKFVRWTDYSDSAPFMQS